jgi:trimethylamine--corrinoid protein Co-methyltransferase
VPTPTPELQPIRPAYHVRILTDQQLDQVRTATLQILQEVGVNCPSARARRIYREHGAQVDDESGIVRLPPHLVLESMAQAPRTFSYGGRLPAFDLRLDGSAMFVATDGCGVETIDFDSQKRRPSTKDDVARMARVADSLSSVGFYWPIVSAQDYPSTAPLHELEASFNNTVKHVQTETVMDERMARYAVEMATVIAGDPATLRSRPPLSALICTIAPLAQDAGGMESALVFAEAGLPVGFMSMANTGSTGPGTIAGTLVAADAEIAAAMVLVQLAVPGAPVYYSLMPGVMHPRTGAYLGTTWEGDPLYPYGVELAHHWGVPTLAGCFGTDAMTPGWQSAGEVPASLLLCALCGAETGSGMGLLESCTLLTPEEIVLDTDLYHRVRILAEGAPIDPDSLALEVIRAVGPRGHFLRQKHTRDSMRRLRFSELTAQPAAGGSYQDPVEVARAKVEWILQHHQPEPLNPRQQAELRRIVQAADQEMT